PAHLLAADPAGTLDSRTSVDVMALFQELNDDGVTILVVTHEPDIATYARRTVELRDGRIIRDEPVHDRRDAAADAREIREAETAGAARGRRGRTRSQRAE